MVRITFCGHHNAWGIDELRGRILAEIENFAKDDTVEFWLGGYGAFDSFALRCCQEYKATHPTATLLFVTPYLDPDYLKRRDASLEGYDGIETPSIENTPPKYCILKRNEYMIDQSDLLIAYVNHGWGGAAKTFEYAVRKHKKYINLGTYKMC